MHTGPQQGLAIQSFDSLCCARLGAGRGGDVPAIALTAFATRKDFESAMSAGFQEHLAKPVDASLLGRTILRISKK